MTDTETILHPHFPGQPLTIQGDRTGEAKGKVYLRLPRTYGHFDADELRDAIDKAVGRREEDIFFQNQVGYYHQLAMHPAFDDLWGEAPPTGDEMAERIDAIIAGQAPKPYEGNKPYRPIDRDRLLRHIEDVEAALTRRNARHEADQERIRELEAEVFTLREIKDSYEEPKTAREYLDLAWEAAHEPEGDVVEEGVGYITRFSGDSSMGAQPGGCPADLPVSGDWGERRLLDPAPTAEEKRRKEYEDAGLQEWEIELLMGGAA